MPILLLAIPVLSTLAGGLLALRLRGLRLFLVAASAGLLLGAAFLDLLPEALDLGLQAGISNTRLLAFTLLFLLIFTALETALDAWSRHDEAHGHGRRTIGLIGGGMLIFHSFRDGMAIGAAFAASHTAGYAVALGIAAHDLGDGMNTVLLTTDGQRARFTDYAFLAADALAPFAGGLVTIWWLLSPRNSALLLALAAAFFLQMAASEFLPALRAHRRQQTLLFACVCAGAGLLYVANVLLGTH